MAGEQRLSLLTSCAGDSGLGRHQQSGWGWELAGGPGGLGNRGSAPVDGFSLLAPSVSLAVLALGSSGGEGGPRSLFFSILPLLHAGYCEQSPLSPWGALES